jgi:hypothetical protein
MRMRILRDSGAAPSNPGASQVAATPAHAVPAAVKKLRRESGQFPQRVLHNEAFMGVFMTGLSLRFPASYAPPATIQLENSEDFASLKAHQAPLGEAVTQTSKYAVSQIS